VCSVCLVSVLRTVWLGQLLYSTDPTWDFTTIANWSTVEINLAIVCACMPTLRPILARMFGPIVNRVFPSSQAVQTAFSRTKIEHPEEGRRARQHRTIGSISFNALHQFGRRGKPRDPIETNVLSTTDYETTLSVHASPGRQKKVGDSDIELVPAAAAPAVGGKENDAGSIRSDLRIPPKAYLQS
jgi:hypothetical protein